MSPTCRVIQTQHNKNYMRFILGRYIFFFLLPPPNLFFAHHSILSCLPPSSASITMQEATSAADSFVNVNYCSLSGVVLAQGEQHLQGCPSSTQKNKE